MIGFYRSELARFRGEKQAYYGHFTETTLTPDQPSEREA